MGKKRSPEERMELARKNGFNDDPTGIDDRVVLRPVLEYTLGEYEKQMEIWRVYEKNHPGASPCDIRTLKHIAELLRDSAQGQLADKPTEDTVRGYMRRFTSGYERETGICIPEQVRKTGTNHIKSFGLPTVHRERHYLTLKKYTILVSIVWENDWHEFDHEGSRVGFSGKMNIFCFSSARIGEVTESSAKRKTGKGLHFRDIIMLVGWGLDGKPEIQMSLKREAAKGMHKSRNRPEHPMFETTSGQPLLFNPILFTLAIALAHGAFKQYQTAEEIFDIQPPEYDDHWILEWADDMLDVPVFQAMSCDGPTGQIQTASSFSKQLTSACPRAGFKSNINIHDARREALVKGNANGYTDAELMKFAGQSSSRVFQASYMAEGGIDGQNSFLNQPLRKDHIESFRGITLPCNPELWQSLPAQIQRELERQPDFVALEEQIEDLTEEMKKDIDEDTSQELQARRYNLYKERRQLTLEELKRRRQNQPRNHPSRGANGHYQSDHHRAFFNRVRHMMPERDRLARSLFLPVPLRSSEGRSALQDLIALYKNDCRVAYQPVLRPISDCCPVSSCALQIQSIRVADRWKHIYRCYEADLKRRYGFAMFCFKCSEWTTNEDDWELHCQGHIDRLDIPLRCDPITFRYALACAGYCPKCFAESQWPAAKRLYQFTNRARWLQHVQKHLQEHIQSIDCIKAIQCPYGVPCTTFLESVEHVWPHLQDDHSIPMPNAGKKRRFDSKSEENTSAVKSDPDRPKRPRLQGKQRTTTSIPKNNKLASYEIQSQNFSEELNYSFINYSSANLNSSNSDISNSPKTTSASSSPNVTRYSSPTSSIGEAGMYKPPKSPVYMDITNEIDPQLLCQPNALQIRGLCPLEHGSPIENRVLEATMLSVAVKDAKALSNVGGSSIDVGTRDLPIVLNDSDDDDESSKLKSNRDCEVRHDEHLRDMSACGHEMTSSPLPMAEAAGEDLPASMHSVQQHAPPAVIPEDDQYIVERLLRRKVVSRGRGRRRRRVTQYFVKWQGYPDEHNTWADEDDIHEDLIAAYNGE